MALGTPDRSASSRAEATPSTTVSRAAASRRENLPSTCLIPASEPRRPGLPTPTRKRTNPSLPSEPMIESMPLCPAEDPPTRIRSRQSGRSISS